MAVTPAAAGGQVFHANGVTVRATAIAGCLIVESGRFDDDRGWFRETWNQSALEAALGRPFHPRQGNHSRSKPGVLRGFRQENWHKLIYVARGHALVVVADVRPDSPTFCQTLQFELGDPPGQRQRIFVAQGLANAFYCFAETDYLNEVS